MEVKRMRRRSFKLITAVVLSVLLVFTMMPATAFADGYDGSITVNVTIKNDTFMQPLKDLSGQTVAPAWTGILSGSAIKVTVASGASLGVAVKDKLGDMAAGDASYIYGFNGLFAGINIEQAQTEWGAFDMSGFQLRINGNSPQLGAGYGAGMSNCVNSNAPDPNLEFKLKNNDNAIIAYSVDGTEVDKPYIYAPTSVTAKLSNTNNSTIKWAKNDKATGYEVYRSTKSGGAYAKVTTLTANTYKDTKLKSGTTYYYKVKMLRGRNTSDFSKVAKATTKPSKPVIKVSKKGKKSLKISWKKVKGADLYQVYRATKKNGKYKKVKTISAKKRSWTNSRLSKDKKYFYKVRAIKKVDGKNVYSAFSAVKSKKR